MHEVDLHFRQIRSGAPNDHDGSNDDHDSPLDNYNHDTSGAIAAWGYCTAIRCRR